MNLTLESAAELIDGNEYGSELMVDGKSIGEDLKAAGLVLFTGQSDDICRMFGAIDDEGYGRTYFKDGELFDDFDPFNDADEMFRWLDDKGILLNLALVEHDFDGVHKITTKVPHEEVRIMEDGEVFSESILVHKEDLWDE